MGAVVAVAAVVVGCGPEVAAPAAKPVPQRIFAYRTVHFGQSVVDSTGDMVLMNGTRQVGRTQIGVIATDPAFTTDGRYVFDLVGDTITAIAAATGKITQVPCDGCGDRSLKCLCQAVVPIGAATVAWVGKDEHLMSLDLAAPGPPKKSAKALPTWKNTWDTAKPHLLAGTDGAVLAAFPDTLSFDTGPAYLVTPDGTARKLAPGRTDAIRDAAFSPDGKTVALSGDDDETCATVTTVDVKSGKGRTAPVHTPPGKRCKVRDGYVGDMWWAADGSLNVYYQAKDNDLLDADQYRLTGGRWALAGAARVSQTYPLPGGATAILDHPGVRDQNFLFLDVDGKHVRVEDGVNRVVVPVTAR
ncbi:hypothetical protein EV186_111129 [Labedaea rhizosphaerae]|uniref:WD40 repeat protein n=1 Tax=Labedaea rhizosphaerae TaxID=598644 RepID=A0A4R6RSZ6_LABRH|nr:hypothetical protein EV186_111129 [Labedaea rhizosphaerae]